MKTFLAGASGVIGRNLIPRLVSGGHKVVGMTGDAAKSGLVRSLGARPVIVNVFDRDGLQDAVGPASPGAVIDQLTSLHGGTMRQPTASAPRAPATSSTRRNSPGRRRWWRRVTASTRPGPGWQMNLTRWT